MALSFGSTNLYLLILGVMLEILAVALPYWWSIGAMNHVGLWVACMPKCQDIPVVTGK